MLPCTDDDIVIPVGENPTEDATGQGFGQATLRVRLLNHANAFVVP